MAVAGSGVGRLVTWILLGLAFLYPDLIAIFDRSLAASRVEYGVLRQILAVSAMTVAHVLPVSAVALLVQTVKAHSTTMRCLLLVVGTISPVWVALKVVSSPIGLSINLTDAWRIGWVAAVGVAALWRHRPAAVPAAGWLWLRITHGVAAAAIALFLVLHVANHMAALAGPEAHTTLMKSIRPIYRGEWTEPVLCLLLVVLFTTGFGLAIRHLAGDIDVFRVLQLASGAYLGVFLVSHVTAVLLWRVRGGETDWAFATGSLTRGGGMLIPYYGFALVALCMHVGCGLRGILLSHGAGQQIGRHVVYVSGVLGVLVASAVMSAALGFTVF